MNKKTRTKKAKLQPLSFKELNRLRGGGGPGMIVRPDPSEGGG